MKADLYTAEVRAAGVGGLAHRTAAGFLVLTSADGDDIIALIDAKQGETDLIDHVVAKAQTDGPASFAMLFTAGGDLYLIASGGASAEISSPSTQLSMSPMQGQVLVHPLSAGIGETMANIWLRVSDADREAALNVELQAGTIEATWLEVAIGGATINAATASGSLPAVSPDIAPAPESTAPTTAAEADPAAEPADPEPREPAPAPAEPEPTETAPESAQAQPQASTPAEPGATPAEPEAAPVDSLEEPIPETDQATAQAPATDGIDFAAQSDPASTPEPESQPSPAAPPIAPSIDPAPEPTSTVGPVMVLGVACSQGHHNHPDAVYCSQCGTKMGVHHTTVLLNGPRPPLGVLVVDDGTTYSLSQDLVIGREPTSHEDVAAGAASPMILTDDTLSLSRKHARIVLHDWSVLIQDLHSSNGTFLSRAGQTENWARVESGATTALEAGDRLRVGGRIIQVELHHVR